MYLIYGSTAIKFWYPDYGKTPKDLDVITEEKIRNHDNKEFYWIDAFTELQNNSNDKYVDPDYLYTIKISHLSWNIGDWDKHMHDAIFLKNKGCKIVEKFYKKLTKERKVIHGNKNVNLSGDNKDFFKKSINRDFDHDWLHTKLCVYDRPMHERIRTNIDKPQCSKILWDNLDQIDKLYCAVEELYVLTCERIFLREENRMSLQFAKTKMLKQMIISSTGGWFNLFLKENFLELLECKPPKILKNINSIYKTHKGVN